MAFATLLAKNYKLYMGRTGGVTGDPQRSYTPHYKRAGVSLRLTWAVGPV